MKKILFVSLFVGLISVSLLALGDHAEERERISFTMGSWEEGAAKLRTINPHWFDFAEPLPPYFMTIEAESRENRGGVDVIHLKVKSHGTIKIQEINVEYLGRELVVQAPQFDLELTGDKRQEIDVSTKIRFEDGTVKNHFFRVWHAPLQVYRDLGLAMPKLSRVVLEASSLSFITPPQSHDLDWWNVISESHRAALDSLAKSVGEAVTRATSVEERVVQIIRLMNQMVWKGSSAIKPPTLTPSEVFNRGIEGDRLTHEQFNRLAILMMRAVGVPARRVLKQAIEGGYNFHLEGTADVVEYFDPVHEKFVMCSPWLSLINIQTANSRPLNVFEVVQVHRMGLLPSMRLVIYDPATDRVATITESNDVTYDPFVKGFDKPYPLNGASLRRHVDHYTKNGDLWYEPVRELMSGYKIGP